MSDDQGEPTLIISEIRKRELSESTPHRAKAARTGKPVTYTASDGCEVTVTPDGSEFFNAADWW